MSSTLFEVIADDIYRQGFSIQNHAVPDKLSQDLIRYNQSMSICEFQEAGIGRKQNYQQIENIRNDKICWIDGSSQAGNNWLCWVEELKIFLNRRLMLGLFSFESHFAFYPQGHFYKRHYDAFKGQANRVLSLVTYLNQNWQANDGGELVLYQSENDKSGTKVAPEIGTIVVFLSEEFPHEVLPALRPRHSVAGWFRINNSGASKVDPPR